MTTLVSVSIIRSNGVTTNQTILINPSRIVSSDAYGSYTLVRYKSRLDNYIDTYVVNDTYTSFKNKTSDYNSGVSASVPIIKLGDTITYSLLVDNVLSVVENPSDPTQCYIDYIEDAQSVQLLCALSITDFLSMASPDLSPVKLPARAATTADIDVTSAPAAIDGVTFALNDRILVKDQATAEENGIYFFNGAGNPLIRTEDFNDGAQVSPGTLVVVSEGTTNADTIWELDTDGTIIVGTTAISFTQFTGGGAVPTLFANALYVDSVYGDDATAVKYSMMDSTSNPASNKYKTIAAAITDAIDGDTIIVLPGLYQEPTLNLFKDSCTLFYYISAGADVSRIDGGGLIDDTGTLGGAVNIYGDGVLSSEGRCINMSIGEAHVKARSIYSAASNAIRIFGSAIVAVEAYKVYSASAQTILAEGATSAARLYVDAHTIENVDGTGTTSRTIHVGNYNGLGSFGGEAMINATYVLGTQSSFSGTGTEIIRIDSNIAGPTKGKLTVNAKEIVYRSSFGITPSASTPRGAIHYSSCHYFDINISGKLILGEMVGISCVGIMSNTSVFTFNGSIVGTDNPVVWSGTFSGNGIMKINADMTTDSATYAAITLNTNDKITFNGSLTQLDATSDGIYLGDNTTITIFDNFKVITSGGNGINANVASTVRVIHSFATNDAIVNTTNSVTGSAFFSDANVL